jgi:hypothetical protein
MVTHFLFLSFSCIARLDIPCSIAYSNWASMIIHFSTSKTKKNEKGENLFPKEKYIWSSKQD